METRPCRNCGQPFTPAHGTGGHIWYCRDLCRAAAHRKRIRIKRTQRNALAQELALRQRSKSARKCLHCRTQMLEYYDGVFCAEACFVTYWTGRLSRGGIRKPLTAEDIVYDPRYSPIIR